MLRSINVELQNDNGQNECQITLDAAAAIIARLFDNVAVSVHSHKYCSNVARSDTLPEDI